MAGFEMGVNEQHIAALNNMATQLQELADKINQETALLKAAYEENQGGLGSHSADIRNLIDDVETTEEDASKPVLKLVLKLQRSALIRQKHIDTNNYTYSKGRSR